VSTSWARALIQTKAVADKHEDEHVAPSGGLHRSLGLMPLTLIGVGATIGTGIFFTMAEAVPKAGPSVILAFLLAALTAGLTALCYAELSFRIPASGSSYSFAYATVGEFAAYIVAFCLLLEYGLAASATAIGWSDYLNNFLMNTVGWQIPDMLRKPMIVATPQGVQWVSGQFNLAPVVLVALCGVLLARGTRESTTTNTVMVIIKLGILAFFAAVALTGFKAEHFTPFFNTDTAHGLAGMSGVTAAAATVFFSFIGLDTVATAGEEARNPRRTVPRALLLALVIVTVFYMAVAVAAIGAQPAAQFAGQEAGLAVILQNVTGQAWPAQVLSAGAVISVFSVTLVTLYGQTRILYAISRDGLAPPLFQRLHSKTQTPVLNTAVVCAVVAVVAGLVDSTLLWDMVSMGTLTAFIVVSLAVPVIRKRAPHSGEGGFQVPFGPYLIPGLSIFACVYIMKDLSGTTFRVFAVWMAVAVLTYLAWGIRHSKLRAR
jgi:APA family basic amino acid/polyamine antiporter